MISIFNFTTERELQDFLIENFNHYFSFDYVCQELIIKCGRIDLVGEDDDNIYLIELKRDIVTQSTIEQLDNYINNYKTTKRIVGIAAAPEIDEKIDLSLFKNDIRPRLIEGVHCLFNYRDDSLKNKVRFSSTLPIELNRKLKECSEETMIPVSKILEKAIANYLNGLNK